MIEQTVASAETNMRMLTDVLPRDAAAIQRAKRGEFHSLGLVLGYSYAGSPVIQPGPRPVLDVTSYTPRRRARRGCRTAGCRTAPPLYDRLGRGFTLVGSATPGVADLVRRARRRGIPLTLAESPPDYPWRSEFLLVRPDQHIAWRAEDPAGIDIDTAAGLHPERDPVRAGI